MAKPRARRAPTQARSIETVKAVFEASALILQRDGMQGLTTARIAEVSGYGVSTIYDYFPNKDAILLAMARRELEMTFQAMQKSVAATRDADAETVIRTLIRAFIRGFAGRQRMRGALLERMIAGGRAAELAAFIDRATTLLLATDGGVASRLGPESLYVLTRAITGAVRAWAMEGGARVSAQCLEVELAELAHAYLQRCLARDRLTPALGKSETTASRELARSRKTQKT